MKTEINIGNKKQDIAERMNEILYRIQKMKSVIYCWKRACYEDRAKKERKRGVQKQRN